MVVSEIFPCNLLDSGPCRVWWQEKIFGLSFLIYANVKN